MRFAITLSHVASCKRNAKSKRESKREHRNPMQKLTTRSIETTRPDPSGKDIYLRDGDGLELRILPSGKKVWQFRYTFEGKRRILGFGDYNFCSLRDARLRAQEARLALANGSNPAERQTQRKNNKKPAAISENTTEHTPATTTKRTLEDLMQAYAEWKKMSGKITHAHKVTITTRLYVTKNNPEIAKKPACECTPADMAALIRPIHDRGKITSASRFRSMLSAAFQAALQAPYDPMMPQNMLGFDVMANPTLALPAIRTAPRQQIMTQDELGKYGATILAGRGISYQCLSLSLLAGGQRPLQVSRVTDDDYVREDGVLLIHDPKGKRQIPRLNFLPLAPYTKNLIAQWLDNGRPIQHPIWFSVDGQTHMLVTSLSRQCTRVCQSLGFMHIQLRDVRRTVETEMARLGVSKDLRAHILSHGLGGIQDRHYDRYDRIDEKRQALEMWEKHLLELMAPYQGKIAAE